MSTRIKLGKAEPAAYKAMTVFDKYLETTKLTPTIRNLINVRTSQLNGCAYCVDKHSKEAREAGETEQRIFALVVWRDTPFFTPEERAILALTEEVTLIGNRVSDKTYNEAASILGDEYLGQALMAIIIMNGWNRIGIALEMQPVAHAAAPAA
jgi:AhpD family alkylhydroperoxidase